MIHWIIERDEKGEPIRLVWSSEIQGERQLQLNEQKLEQAAQAFINALPMPAMREWARKRGIIS